MYNGENSHQAQVHVKVETAEISSIQSYGEANGDDKCSCNCYVFYFFWASGNMSLASWADPYCSCIGKNCMLGASSLVLVFVNGQNQFLGMHGSLANGVHYKTVHRRMDSETEE